MTSVTITLSEARRLVEFFGDDDDPETEACISRGQGHSGEGLYAWIAEYPEEGTMFLGGEPAEAQP